jgi:hypothetical protein
LPRSKKVRFARQAHALRQAIAFTRMRDRDRNGGGFSAAAVSNHRPGEKRGDKSRKLQRMK